MPFGITVTNVNAGPAIQTSFSTRCGNDAFGGKGTRVLPQQDDPTTAGDDYLHAMVEKTVTSMREKMLSADAQSSESVAHGLIELVNQRLSLLTEDNPDLTLIPFNVGSNAISQGLLEETRKYPSGWGGIFTNILKSMPPVDKL
jgi:hypothetical protein